MASRFCLCFLSTLVVVSGQTPRLPSECDDLPWANVTTHVPVGEGNGSFTAQPAFSWHVHYLHYNDDEEEAVKKFQKDFCSTFAALGKGGAIQPSPWGPNAIAAAGRHVWGDCDASTLATRSNGWTCGNGTCPDGDPQGPWSLCQNEFYVPASHIDEVTRWIVAYEDLVIPVMRHPNSGCQWGDHAPADRAEFFGPARVPEMCLWGLPCNEPGCGCRDGMCGDVDGTRAHQHAAGCVLEVGE